MSGSPFEKLNYDDFKGSKVGEFFKLMKDKDKDCPQPDCDKLVSPCCSVAVTVVFGSIPLEVQCSACGTTFFLKKLITS